MIGTHSRTNHIDANSAHLTIYGEHVIASGSRWNLAKHRIFTTYPTTHAPTFSVNVCAFSTPAIAYHYCLCVVFRYAAPAVNVAIYPFATSFALMGHNVAASISSVSWKRVNAIPPPTGHTHINSLLYSSVGIRLNLACRSAVIMPALTLSSMLDV